MLPLGDDDIELQFPVRASLDLVSKAESDKTGKGAVWNCGVKVNPDLIATGNGMYLDRVLGYHRQLFERLRLFGIFDGLQQICGGKGESELVQVVKSTISQNITKYLQLELVGLSFFIHRPLSKPPN